MFEPDKKLLGTIDSWIEENKASFIRDLDRLVAVPSISEEGKDGYPYGKNCARVLDEASSIAEEYGFHLENHEYHCGTCLLKGESEHAKRIGLYAHLDVVPLGEGWNYPPLKCTVQDGFLIGRGVGDNKGPGMCALYALRFLKEHGICLKNDVVLYMGLNEEAGMHDVEYFCKTQRVPDFNLVTDTNFPLCYGEKGRICVWLSAPAEGNLLSFQAGSVVNVIPSRAEAVIKTETPAEAEEFFKGLDNVEVRQDRGDVHVTAHGISKHSGFPEDSVNAIHVLAEALTASGLLEGTAAETMGKVAALTSDYYGESIGMPLMDEESGRLTCVGSVANLEDGRFRIAFDIRYPVTADRESVEAQVLKKMESLGFSYEIEEMSGPAYTPLSHPYIPVLQKVSDFVQGKHYEPYTMGGGTYARHLPSAVGFGPGVPDAPNLFPRGRGQGHQPDESISLEVLLKGLKTYIIALMELDKIL